MNLRFLVLLLTVFLFSCVNSFNTQKMSQVKLGKRLDKSRVVYAINCGNKKPYTSTDGFTYQEDVRHFSGNTQVATYYDHPKVPSYGFRYTEDSEIHRIERWAQGNLAYNLPIYKPDKYVLILKFSEVNFMGEGSRVFNIKLGKDYVKKGFDILRGGHTAEVNLYIPIELNEKKEIIYNGSVLKNAFQSNHLNLVFEPVADNPKVNGIILYRGDLKDTDYHNLEQIRSAWDKQFKTIMEKENMRDQIMDEYMEKKRIKKKIRNDFEDLNPILDEDEQIIDLGANGGSKGFGLKKLVLSILLVLAQFCMFNRRSKVTVKSKDKCDEVMAENQDLSEDRSKSSPPKDELKKKESDIEGY